jgi:hypothetical protein
MIASISFGCGVLDRAEALKPTHHGLGYDLASVYLVWLLVLLIMYAICRYFGKLKERRKSWWLAYL